MSSRYLMFTKNGVKSWAQSSSRPFVSHLPLRYCFLYSWARQAKPFTLPPLKHLFTHTRFLKHATKRDGTFCDLQRGPMVASLESTASSPICLSFHAARNPSLCRLSSSPGVSPVSQKTIFQKIWTELYSSRCAGEWKDNLKRPKLPTWHRLVLPRWCLWLPDFNSDTSGTHSFISSPKQLIA